MRAFLLHSYGSDLQLRQADRPVPGAREVLVRVRATSVQPYDWHHLRGEPYVARLLPGTLGLRRPKIAILGADVAGQVEAVGSDVTLFRPGDDVFALVPQGGFAEYVCVPERELAPKPTNLSYEQAGAVPMAACTALLAVRDQGRVQPGQNVLVNGAAGGVGTFAVQLARALGARVTGVCSTRNVEFVRSVGVDEVVDYAAADFTQSGQRYDLLVDVAGGRSLAACRRALTRRGSYVMVGGPAGRWCQPAAGIFGRMAAAPFVPQRVAVADVLGGAENQANLVTLTRFLEDGTVTPVIDRCYPFEEIPAALRYSEAGRAQGKIVIKV